ncbi:MAG: NYN domain-containing protein, partial [bacterium]|nr:NYN domain-containing protein [bacterium]
TLIEEHVRAREQGYTHNNIVYAAWFQGLFTSTQADEAQLRKERNRYHDLMHAGIVAKYHPMSGSQAESGTDVALAVEALEMGLAAKMDVAVLVTGDGDFVPLARELMKHGVSVMVAYFDYEDGEYKGFANARLLSACNYELNVNALEARKETSASFRSLFRKYDPEEGGSPTIT